MSPISKGEHKKFVRRRIESEQKPDITNSVISKTGGEVDTLSDEFKKKLVIAVDEIHQNQFVSDVQYFNKLLSLIASEIEKAEKQAWTEGYTSGKEADA